jgi:Tn3 transposase DDE domain
VAQWHISDDNYVAARAAIINVHHRHPMAAIWDDGTTSSSDGQYFRAGGRAGPGGAVNAATGPSPATFSSRMSRESRTDDRGPDTDGASKCRGAAGKVEVDLENLHARHRAEREFGAIGGMPERCGSTVDRALSAATGLSYGARRGRTYDSSSTEPRSRSEAIGCSSGPRTGLVRAL